MKNSGINSFEEFNKRGVFREEGHQRFNNDQNEEKQNLTIVAPSKIVEQYKELTKWEKLFVVNFYEQGGKPNGKERFVKVREAIDNELDRLYALVDDNAYFRIDIEDNKFLDRHFQSELKALEARGEKQKADLCRSKEREAKIEMAKEFEKLQ